MVKMLLGKPGTMMLAAAACVLGSFTVYANIGLLAASGWLISAAALQPPIAALSVAIVGVRFFGLARAVCRYGERYVSHNVTFRLLADIRVWLYDKIEQQPSGGLAAWGKGDILSRLVGDVETLQFFYLRAVLPIGIAILTTAAVAALLALLAPWLVIAVVAVVFLTGALLPLLLYRPAKRAGQTVLAARAVFTEVLADSIDGLAELAAFGQAGAQVEKVLAGSRSMQVSQEQSNRIKVLTEVMGTLGMNAVILVIVVLSAPLVAGHRLDGVYLAVIVLAVQASFEAILPLPAVVYYLQESAAAVRRIRAAASQSPPVLTQATKGFAAESAISFTAHNLSFAYRPDLPPALSGVSFELPSGKRLAIVGASGAGKSTLAGLLLRFGELSDGQLLVNGADIRQYAPEEVRRLFSVVSQATYLFNASIRDNILLARPNAAPQELQAAIEKAMLAEFIGRLPGGLDTPAGQNGLALSGGERQRIALARALLKDAPVWLLDEPTAGLDAEAEQQMMANILQAAGSRSVIVITHRLTGLAVMDEILVLDNGRIAEQGTWHQLMSKKGQFYQMWQLQQDLVNIA